jgi:pimeloyl-ACP methyl ester carboxylesterase
VAHGNRVDLFNTTFLRKSKDVRAYLIQDQGFTTGYFLTQDAYALNYLFRKSANARCTIICAVGFWPGRKEGMATLHALLPQDYNLLFFDARGRGKSDGFYYSLWQYGINEYKDVLAAIDFAQTADTCPIILYGVCAGAFHAAHALCKQPCERVCGLIMDSAWSSVTKVSRTALTSELKKRLRNAIKECTNHYQLRNLLYRPTACITDMSASLAHRIFFVPLLYAYRAQTDLTSKIHKIAVPILYIHSYDDEYTESKAVEELIAKTQRPYSWWITEHSTHAVHHLKHPMAYKEKLMQFITMALS